MSDRVALSMRSRLDRRSAVVSPRGSDSRADVRPVSAWDCREVLGDDLHVDEAQTTGGGVVGLCVDGRGSVSGLRGETVSTLGFGP
jgi:hypothetical protein